MTMIRSGNRLHDKTIFLSASVPDSERDPRFHQIADAAFQIEQAVISLARAVFSEGGRLVFGGHPSISPLVSIVAGEYRQPVRAESDAERPPAQVVIYQSEVFREAIPEDSSLLIDLGLAEARWIEGDPDEWFLHGAGSAAQQCPKSLRAMRERMIAQTEPVAMVCIGGMEGVIAEAALFEGRGPIFALVRTGGAAAILTEEREGAVAIDNDIMALLDEAAARRRDEGEDLADDRFHREGDIEVIPYPLIMQTIVSALAEDDARAGE